MKFLKTFLIIFTAFTLASLIWYCFTLSKMEFNFANEGKIICVTKKDFGFLSAGKLTCFGVVPLNNGFDRLLQTVNNLDENGEIILKVK